TSINRGLRHAELEVFAEPKADPAAAEEGLRIQILAVLPLRQRTNTTGIRVVNEFLAGKPANERVESDVTEETKNPRQAEWRNPVQAEHVDGLGVVGKRQRAACTRSPPKALPAKRHLPIRDVHSHVCVQQVKLAGGRHWDGWGVRWQVIYVADEIEHRR